MAERADELRALIGEPWDYVIGDPQQASRDLLRMLRVAESHDLLALNREGQRELIVTLDALLAELEDEREMSKQVAGSLRNLRDNWPMIIDALDPDGFPLIENLLGSAIDDLGGTASGGGSDG